MVIPFVCKNTVLSIPFLICIYLINILYLGKIRGYLKKSLEIIIIKKEHYAETVCVPFELLLSVRVYLVTIDMHG